MSDQSTSQETAPKPVARILIAEDHSSMRRALGVLFGLHKNWEVCGEAEDANEAIRKAEQLHPDLIVLDYKMHCSDGFQAANGILRALPDVPIVLFTLYKTDELERAANQIGIRRAIGKEEGVQTLLHAMEELQLGLESICLRPTLSSLRIYSHSVARYSVFSRHVLSLMLRTVLLLPGPRLSARTSRFSGKSRTRPVEFSYQFDPSGFR